MCEKHWKALRDAIIARDLEHLLPPDGEVAMNMMADQLEKGGITPVNYEPMAGAFFGISSNVMTMLANNGVNPMVLMTADAPDEGCVLCYANRLHAESCNDERCVLDKENGFDWMIDRAADDAKQKAEQFAAEAGS